MTEEVITTEEAPVIETPEAPTEQKEQTIGEAMNIPEKKSSDTVGIDKFLSEKQGRREAEKKIKELEEQIAKGATRTELSEDLEDFTSEYPDVDPKFISKLLSAAEARAAKKVEGALQPINEKNNAEKIDKIFTQHFSKTMENMPEFNGIVNAEVIKQLSLLPANKNKTFKTLIEETYGNSLGGRKTIESNNPKSMRSTEGLDFDRARKDPAYFAEVMANPVTKAQYNENIEKRLNL